MSEKFRREVELFLEFFEGKKTYMVAGAAVLYMFGADQGWWSESQRVLDVLTFSGLATLRASIR